MLLIAFLAYQSFTSLKEKNQWVHHTYAVLADVDKLSALISDIQNGQRGYAITGDSLYLEPYIQSIDSVAHYITDLRLLTADNLLQQNRVNRLEAAVSQAIDVQTNQVLLKSKGHTAELMSHYSTNKGKKSIDQITALMHEIKQEENKLLAARTAALDASFAITEQVLYGMAGIFALIILLLYLLLSRQFTLKDTYEKELNVLNDDLYQSNQELLLFNEELNSNREELHATVEQLEVIKTELEKIVDARTASLQEINAQLLQEITLHKTTELALLKSQERFRVALENAQLMVFNSDKEGRYTWVHNTSAGFGNQHVLGKTDAELLPETEAGHIRQLKCRVFETGKGIKEEITITTHANRNHYFLINLQPLMNRAGEVQEITGTAYNITDRKLIEKNLQNTLLELQKRNFELDNYVYKVSHDLRSPLTSVMGLIQLMQAEENPETKRTYLNMVENRINKLDDFIKSILNHSKSINSDSKISAIAFRQIIADCIEELKYLPNSGKINISVDITEEVPFFSDELRLTILFKNFISNAIKYLNPAASQSYLSIVVRSTATQAFIRLEDNGIGISQEYISKIYNMFFRATQSSDGSGLGLYIVKQNIEKLKGQIEVESEVNKGTTFKITLPNIQITVPSVKPLPV